MNKYNLGQWIGQPLRIYPINSDNKELRELFYRANQLGILKQNLLNYYSSLSHHLDHNRLLNPKESQKKYNKTIYVLSSLISLIQNSEWLDKKVVSDKLVKGCLQLNRLYQGNFNLNIWLEITLGVSLVNGIITKVDSNVEETCTFPNEMKLYSSGVTIRPDINTIRITIGDVNNTSKIIKFGIDISLDQRRFDDLMDKCGDNYDHFVMMLYRYYFLLWESGIFLSVIPSLWPFIKQYVKDNMSTNTKLVEGFACPLNNNLPNYCSVYEEDRIFGSLGNFFSYQPDGRTFMIINPPFVESILTKAGQKIVEWLNYSKNFSTLLIWPYWMDDAGPGYWNEESLNIILSLPDNIMRWQLKLEKGTYDIFNTSTGETFISTFRIILIFLSNDPMVTLPITSLQNLIGLPVENILTDLSKSFQPVVIQNKTDPVEFQPVLPTLVNNRSIGSIPVIAPTQISSVDPSNYRPILKTIIPITPSTNSTVKIKPIVEKFIPRKLTQTGVLLPSPSDCSINSTVISGTPMDKTDSSNENKIIRRRIIK